MPTSVHCNHTFFFFAGLLIAFHQKINYIANGSLLKACIKTPYEGQKNQPYGDSSCALTLLASFAPSFSFSSHKHWQMLFLHQLMWRQSGAVPAASVSLCASWEPGSWWRCLVPAARLGLTPLSVFTCIVLILPRWTPAQRMWRT